MSDDVKVTREIKDGMIIESEERQLNDEEAARMDNNMRIIERFEKPRYVDERKSDDPFAAVWRELQRFAGDDAARRAVAERGISDESRLKALRNEVRLGDAYYLSYRDADEVIDPVILYYGAYALAKAICYSALDDDGFALWRKRPTHGISSKIGASLLDSEISFQNNGTLQAFAYVLGGDAPREGTMRASDLFRAVPELDGILRDLGLCGTSAMPIFHFGDEDERAARAFRAHEHIHIIADEGYTAEDFEREVPIIWALMSRGALLQIDARQISWKTKVGGEAELLFMAMRTPGGLFFERRLPGGFYIPEMAVHLILLHLLADYARYRPDEWIDMVDSHNDQYSLVREFIHVSEYKFPILVLNELTWRTFAFSHY
jgi:hypothetical protein